MTAEEIEQRYLSSLLDRVKRSLFEIKETIEAKKEEIDEMHRIMQEQKRDMDHLDKNQLREAIFNQELVGAHAVEKRMRLARLLDVPYFGRIDFQEKGTEAAQLIYVGVYNYMDESSNQNLVYDWRAPISSMFYDFEKGDSFYETEKLRIEGDITLKRQFRIREGKMEYMLESDVTIHDEVLQKELNQSSSGKMKNIVATIQREQNAIIRNEAARHLIIQGVAGSGKTSIALHRIAYLLYKFRDTISSEDILILSPNKVFAHYISNVLPELGEETIAETSMEEIADKALEYQIRFQSFFEQVAELLTREDKQYTERIQFKSSITFLNEMDRYLAYLENEGFKPEDIIVRKKLVPAWFLEDTYKKYHRLPILKRFNELVKEVVGNVFIYYKMEIMGEERAQLHTTLRKMFPSTNLRMLYKGFYEWLGRPEMLRLRKGAQYEYSDVYPLVYLKMKLEGAPTYRKVKHLVIDEMQDYSPVQYRVLGMLFPCKKTILGDINQSVNPFSSSGVEHIQAAFPGAMCMIMLKSYRSTWEITQFARQIRPGVEVEPMERHGEKPVVTSHKSSADEMAFIRERMLHFRKGAFQSLGIICRTQDEAEGLHATLGEGGNIHILRVGTGRFGAGVVITSAHLSKGLEFDEVLIPFCTAKNYRTETDRQMLYVACTRAMHRLALSHQGPLTSFLIGVDA